jgi:hypothetical protein
MKHFTGYGAYLVFVTVRTHFESPTFDFFKHKNVKANKATYLKRNDKSFFDMIAKDYDAKEIMDFFVANRLEGRNYITDLLDDDAQITYINYKRRIQALTYNFKNEIESLNCPDAFKCREDQYPEIVQLYLQGRVSHETMVILNDYTSFIDKFDKYYDKNDPIWSKISLKLRKYKPFVKYPKDKIKSILKEKINENTPR